jgi:hypothetical protein
MSDDDTQPSRPSSEGSGGMPSGDVGRTRIVKSVVFLLVAAG